MPSTSTRPSIKLSVSVTDCITMSDCQCTVCGLVKRNDQFQGKHLKKLSVQRKHT